MKGYRSKLCTPHPLDINFLPKRKKTDEKNETKNVIKKVEKKTN